MLAGHRPTPRRRHRWITTPAGLLLFICLVLPGYRNCGRNIAMTHEPLLVGACLVGLVAAVASIAFAGRRFEHWIARASIAAAVIAAGILSLACAAADEAYAGVTLGIAASASLMGGGLVWEREARGSEAAALYLRVLAPLAIAAVAFTAALSEWHPPPETEITVPIH